MSKQPALNDIFQELERKLEEVVKQSPTINNSGKKPQGEWTRKIVSKVNISDLASEFGVTQCPECDYQVYFDNSIGGFCCVNARFNKTCDFKGNIVEFVKRCGN